MSEEGGGTNWIVVFVLAIVGIAVIVAILFPGFLDTILESAFGGLSDIFNMLNVG